MNDLVKEKKKQDYKLNQVKFVPKAERKKLREQQEREEREQARREAEEQERRRREYRRRLEREREEQRELERRESAKKREEEEEAAAAERQAGSRYSRGGRGRGGSSASTRGAAGRAAAEAKDPAALSDEAARQKEVEAIKQQHLGGKKRSTKVRRRPARSGPHVHVELVGEPVCPLPRTRPRMCGQPPDLCCPHIAAAPCQVVKPSEKFTRIFQFDWDSKEDTSVDYNPLYAKRKEVGDAARAPHTPAPSLHPSSVCLAHC